MMFPRGEAPRCGAAVLLCYDAFKGYQGGAGMFGIAHSQSAQVAAVAALTILAAPASAAEKVRPGMTASEVEAVLGKPAARARFSDRLLIRWERPGGKKKAEPRTYVFDEQQRLVGPLSPEGPAPKR